MLEMREMLLGESVKNTKSKGLPKNEKEARIRLSMGGKLYRLLDPDLREMLEEMLRESHEETILCSKQNINLKQNIILLVEKLKDKKLQNKIAAPILNINSDVERSNAQDKGSLTGISSAADAAADDHTTDDYINKKRHFFLHKK